VARLATNGRLTDKGWFRINWKELVVAYFKLNFDIRLEAPMKTEVFRFSISLAEFSI
jgi:hypothetical protein